MTTLQIGDADIIVFTDGSSRGNPGPGGYGVVTIYKDSTGVVLIDELGGREDVTTNNRMELKAVIEGIKNFEGYYAKLEDYTYHIYLDSSYVLNGLTKWVKGWKRNGWVTGTKEEVKNQDLWKELDALQTQYNIKLVHIKGHAGITGNERCDEIATDFADNKKVDLYTGTATNYSISLLDILNIRATAEALSKKKKSSSSAKAYSYVSLVEGKIYTDSDWKTCEARVKGKSGVRFKKSLSAEDEKTIVKDFLSNNS